MLKEAIVPAPYHGERVDIVLAHLFSDFSRSQLTTWLKDGLITVNENNYKPKDKVSRGDSIKLNLPDALNDAVIEAEAIPLTVIFEDEHLLVINKPAGLVVHPGAGNPKHTLVNALLHHSSSLNQLPRAGIIHRLDKDTTGLLIIAKTLPAYTNLIRQMQARDIQRHYLTLVYGHVVSGGTLDTYYGRHPRNRLKMAVCAQGKQAITQFTLQKQYQYFTLLNVKLMTGRTHQIRVHMAHMNHPVVGDSLYGGQIRMPVGATDSLRHVLQHFKRQALHAYRLSFTHPSSQEQLNFTAPLPDDFQLLLTTLDENFD